MVNKGDTEPSDKHRLFMDLRFEFPDGESVLFRDGESLLVAQLRTCLASVTTEYEDIHLVVSTRL